MEKFVTETAPQVVVLVAVTAIVIAIGVWVLRRFRGSGADDQQTTTQHLSNFEEMHAQGVLDDEEFREIKRTCKQHLHAEFSDAGKPLGHQNAKDSVSANPDDSSA
jgi:FtsZ-interacting cell division protein ZipA